MKADPRATPLRHFPDGHHSDYQLEDSVIALAEAANGDSA